MKFIILLCCILIQAFLNLNIKYDRHVLLEHYASFMKPILKKLKADFGWGSVIGLLVPILIIIFILDLLFHHIAILYFIYGVIVLLLCLDIRDMKKQLSEYFNAYNSEDLGKAQSEAQEFVNHSVHQNKGEISRAVTEAIFTKSLTNIFSVIIWFMLLGPFGAVLYSMTTAIRNGALKPEFCYSDTFIAADFLKELLDWIPIRIMVLTFALIGHFAPVFAIWVDRLGGGLPENRQLIIDSGLTALNADLNPATANIAENEQALHLVTRTLWTWVIIIGVLTVTSWL